jgi:hypothetical protein
MVLYIGLVSCPDTTLLTTASGVSIGDQKSLHNLAQVLESICSGLNYKWRFIDAITNLGNNS